MTTTDDFLRDIQKARRDFSPHLKYDPDSDCLFAYLRDVPFNRRRVNDIVNVYESIEDKEMAGCLIKGVRKLLEKWGSSVGIQIAKGGRVRASLVISACIEQQPRIIEELGGSKKIQRLFEAAKQEEFELCGAGKS